MLHEIKSALKKTNYIDNEVEIQMRPLGFHLLNQMYSTIQDYKLEYYLEAVWFDEDKTKYRIRLPMTTEDLKKNPSNLIKSRFRRVKIVEKRKVQVFEFINFNLVESTEEVSKSHDILSLINNNIIYRVVTNFIFDLDSILVDFKCVTKINNHRINAELVHPLNIPFFSTEFEIKKPEGIDLFWESLYPRLMNISHIEDIGIDSLVFPVSMFTNTINMLSLLEIKDYTKYFLTTKIDGQNVRFKLTKDKDNKSVLYMESSVGSLSVRSFRVDAKWPFVDLCGYGEYLIIDKKRYLFPISILKDGVLVERTEQHKIKFPEGDITFIHKPYYFDFESSSQFFATLCELLKKNIYEIGQTRIPTDGAIMGTKESDAKSVMDYKIKLDNTIDMYMVFNYTSNYSFVNKKGSETHLNMHSYYTFNKQPKLNKISLWHLNNATFNNTGQFIEFETSTGQKQIAFNKFILETLVNDESTIVRPRMDKTMNTWVHKTNFGNKQSVAIENTGIILEDLMDLMTDYEAAYTRLVSNKGFASHDNLGALNTGKVYYKEANNRLAGRTHRLFTNMVVSRILFPHTTKFRLGRQCVLLDVDGGRGGIIQKAYFSEVKFLLISETIDETLKEARQRLYDMSNQKPNMFKYDALHDTIRSPSYSKRVKSILTTHKLPGIDVIYIGFAVHFSIDTSSAESIQVFMNNLNDLCKPGTRVIITTMDGQAINKMLNLRDTIQYNVDDNTKFIIKRGSHPNTISVMNEMSSEVYIDEYLIEPDSFIKILDKNKYYLLEHNNFTSFVNMNRDFYESGEYLLEPRENTRNFSNTIKQAFGDTRYDMSLLGLSVYYIFVKQ